MSKAAYENRRTEFGCCFSPLSGYLSAAVATRDTLQYTFYKYLHCAWFIFSSHEVKQSEILRCLTLVAVLTNPGARTLTNMTSQWEERDVNHLFTRVLWERRLIYDLYLYKLDCKKNKKERTSSHKKREPLRNYNQDENGGVRVDTVKRGWKNFQFFWR